jgi:DNA-binding NarL/FixJ family response regulator
VSRPAPSLPHTVPPGVELRGNGRAAFARARDPPPLECFGQERRRRRTTSAAAALRLGASGFVLKTAPIAELVEAIRRAAAGGLAFGVRPIGLAPIFTAREREVVALVVEGRSNDEIGVALGITSKTVEAHLRRLFDRLGLQSRTELATRALREGWLEIP